MARTVKDYMADANAAVERLDIEEARKRIADGALVVDVRDANEVEKAGRIPGALNVSRGMLEFRADPATPYHDPAFTSERTILVYCASGGRSALAGKVLKDMGYREVFNIGGFKDWQDAGGEVEPPAK